jgi:hypothetical protein
MAVQILGSDKILRLNDFPLLGMVQNHDAQINTNPEEIFELGRTSKIDTALELDAQGSFELVSIGNTAGLLARMIPVRNPSTQVFSGYLYSGNSNKNSYCVDEGDVVECQFDLAVYERPDQVNFTRSFWYPRCFLTQISGRAEAAGNARETYNWRGTFVTALNAPYHDIATSPCTVASSTTLTVSSGYNSSAYTLVYVYVDERRFRNSTTSDATKFSYSGTTLTVVTTEGYTIPSNAIARALFYKTTSPSATFPSVSSPDRGTSAFYVKGYQVNLYLGPADPDNPLSSEQFLKVQSMDYTIDLRSEDLRQLALNLAGSSIYATVPTLPFSITVNCTVYEYDLTWWQNLMTKTPGTNVYTDSFDYDPATLKGNPSDPLALVAEYYTKAGVLLQELKFTDLIPESIGDRVQVQGRSEVNMSFRGTAFEVCGYNA